MHSIGLRLVLTKNEIIAKSTDFQWNSNRAYMW